MSKRLMDVTLAILLLAMTSPMILAAMLLIFAYDRRAPIYWAPRVGRGGRDFAMAKLRTMAVGADRRGGSSASRSDPRITPPGRVLRRMKIDELPQLWNVLLGQMSLVGPRPNIRHGGVDRYTHEEMALLGMRPGITDLASIVFADEADILEGGSDPDACYDQLIRPWKSRLGLLYLRQRSFGADLWIICLTILAILHRRAAQRGVERIVATWGSMEDLRLACRRGGKPLQVPPPGVPA
jgi:lipopolysaccharide/colanic/teichoic acid biosynthesis glycosyltransferase